MKKPRIKSLYPYLLIGSLLFLPGQLKTQDIPVVIKARKIMTVTKGILKDGMIVIQNGKILALGKDVRIPRNSKVMDIGKNIIIPGIVDAGTTIGIDRKDLTEMFDPIVPQLKIIDSFNPFGKTGIEPANFMDAIKEGVTSVFLYPGNNINVIAGQGAVVKLSGKSLKEMIVKESAALVVNLGDTPRDTYKGMKRMPTTRMGIMATLKGAFQKAHDYVQRLKSSPDSSRDSKMEALVLALNRVIPTRIHANRLDDIVAAIKFSEEFNLQLILDHCVEGHKIAGVLAKKAIPVIVHNNFLPPTIFEETKNFDEKYASVLSNQGVKVAFQSDSVVGGKILKFARLNAIIYVSYGLNPEQALKGLTLYPAQFFGVADRIGSLEVGKDADLVILDGDPLDVYSKVKAVWIGGRIVYKQ